MHFLNKQILKCNTGIKNLDILEMSNDRWDFLFFFFLKIKSSVFCSFYGLIFWSTLFLGDLPDYLLKFLLHLKDTPACPMYQMRHLMLQHDQYDDNNCWYVMNILKRITWKKSFYRTFGQIIFDDLIRFAVFSLKEKV